MMGADESSQFGLDVWPGVPLRLPPFIRRSRYRLDMSGSALVGAADGVPVTERLGEIYLRLYELNLDNADEILAFAQTYGAVNGTFVYTTVQGWSFVQGRYDPAAERREREAIIAGDAEAQDALNPSSPDGSRFQPLEITPLSSFVFAAHYLRDLTTAWLHLNNDPSLDPARIRWETRPEADPPTRSEALVTLTYGLQPLLRRFHPFVHATRTDDPDDAEGELDRLAAATQDTPKVAGTLIGQAQGLGNPQLPEICALELYNHIASQDAYRRCQNETCGRIFVRQYGRAEHGQSRRQGVFYCSWSCANAQTQRTFRRRQSARRRAQTKP